MTIQTVNPATGKPLKDYPEMSTEEVSQIIDAAHDAHLQWREVSFAERAKKMKKAAAICRDDKTKFATIIANEMGKPLKAGEGELEKCAWVCEYYADNAETFLQPEVVKTEMRKSYVAYRPLGVIFAIMPWNFPFWQVFRFATPNLMAGNAGLLKHAPISTGAALAIEDIFKRAGFPDNLFRSLIIDVDEAARVIANPKVKAVTLTGSSGAGRAVGAEAARNLKKVVLELGGSDPYLILEDADLDLAAEECVTSRMNNSGQVCIAAKRVIVVDKIRDEFERIVKEKCQRYVMGDPLKEGVNFGPLARQDIRDGVHDQVQRSIQAGADLVMGGEIPAQEGFYYPPTMLRNVKPGTPAFDEEIFGPVIAIIPVKDEAQAIEVANDSVFGLAGAVFTKDIARGEAIARDKIRVGSCAVNTHVASDPRLPFGGINESGYGRELSIQGIHEFVNVKTINIK